MTPDEKRAYGTAWHRKKYQTDPEFRERQQASNRASAKRRHSDEDPERRAKRLEAARESRRKFLAANPNYDRDRRARLKAERTKL